MKRRGIWEKLWAKFEPENERIEIISILAASTTQAPPAALIDYINGATDTMKTYETETFTFLLTKCLLLQWVTNIKRMEGRE